MITCSSNPYFNCKFSCTFSGVRSIFEVSVGKVHTRMIPCLWSPCACTCWVVDTAHCRMLMRKQNAPNFSEKKSRTRRKDHNDYASLRKGQKRLTDFFFSFETNGWRTLGWLGRALPEHARRPLLLRDTLPASRKLNARGLRTKIRIRNGLHPVCFFSSLVPLQKFI